MGEHAEVALAFTGCIGLPPLVIGHPDDKNGAALLDFVREVTK